MPIHILQIILLASQFICHANETLKEIVLTLAVDVQPKYYNESIILVWIIPQCSIIATSLPVEYCCSKVFLMF